MSELDLEHLLGGYATNTLTEAEHQALFKAAMVNQRLFDLLADEQALKELLDDPGVRRRLLQKLKEPQGQERVAWLEWALGWITRPEILTTAGSLAVVIVATVLGIHFYEESQKLLFEDASAPPLSQIITEPTVRSKLPAKPARQSSAPAAAPEQEKKEEPPNAPSSKAAVPRSPERERPIPEAPGPPAEAPKTSKKDAPARETTGTVRPSAQEEERPVSTRSIEKAEAPMEVPSKPSTLPPVVLPRVPSSPSKSEMPEMDQARKARPESPEPKANAPVASSPAAPPVHEPVEPTTDARQSMEPADDINEPTAVLQEPETTAPFFEDSLKAPAVGNARALFLGRNTMTAGLSKQSESRRIGASPSEGTDTQPDPAAETTRPQEDVSRAGSSSAAERSSAQPTEQSPLGMRFHRRHLPLQGSGAGQPSEGLVIPQLTIEVNQPGYLYVIMRDPRGEWTVLSPAGTTGAGEATRPVAAQPTTPYRVLLVGDSPEQVPSPTYVVFTRLPEPILDRALVLVAARETQAAASAELEATLAPWIRGFPSQSLKTEQVGEQSRGSKPVQTTYVADAGAGDALLYRLPVSP